MAKNKEKTVVVRREETITAPAGNIFPLACPVMEYKWISGWKCELVHCPKGVVEKGCIFNEIMSAPLLMNKFYGKTRWTAVLHDPDGYRVHYRLDNAVSHALFKIEMTPLSPLKTFCCMELSYAPLNRKGEKIIENNLSCKLYVMPYLLLAMLKHYCENGKMMSRPQIIKMSFKFNCFSVTERAKQFLNSLAMVMMKDENRNRFLKRTDRIYSQRL